MPKDDFQDFYVTFDLDLSGEYLMNKEIIHLWLYTTIPHFIPTNSFDSEIQAKTVFPRL